MNNLHEKFSKIYDKNINNIYRFIYFKVNSEQIAEDLCSETFIRAWKAFNRDNNHFEQEINNPRAFLYQIARNLVIDYYKQKDRAQTISLDNVVLADQGPSLEEKVNINFDMNNIRLAMQDLNQDYQDIIIWHYIEGLSCREIARIMNKSYGSTRVTLSRALNALREKV
ncbi:MAG: RNA polymerase sigma factor [Candidatus Pacebacteria bacterium]|nr:RNA polymerase sigma factor [Candidatus Paceibacterota bacterium]